MPNYDDATEQHGMFSSRPSETPKAASPHRQITPGRIIILVLVLATIAVLLRALLTPSAGLSDNDSGPAAAGTAAPLVNHYAPNATLVDLHNKRVALSSWHGKVVVLNFCYVACQPCQYEMPDLQKVYEAEYSRGLVVVGINTSDDATSISRFLKDLGITYPVLRDVGQRTTIEYRIVDTPTSFIIDRNGVIRYKVIGPLDKATLNHDISSLLAQS